MYVYFWRSGEVGGSCLPLLVVSAVATTARNIIYPCPLPILRGAIEGNRYGKGGFTSMEANSEANLQGYAWMIAAKPLCSESLVYEWTATNDNIVSEYG